MPIGKRPLEDDGWRTVTNEAGDEDLPPLQTTAGADSNRTIIAHTQSPDISFDQSLNPHGAPGA